MPVEYYGDLPAVEEAVLSPSGELVELPGEDHWLSQASTCKAMLEAAIAFVKKHNPPQASGTGG